MARILAVIFCLISFPAQALTLNCKEVREYVAKYGKAVALAYAIRNGATWNDILEARKCLKK